VPWCLFGWPKCPPQTRKVNHAEQGLPRDDAKMFENRPTPDNLAGRQTTRSVMQVSCQPSSRAAQIPAIDTSIEMGPRGFDETFLSGRGKPGNPGVVLHLGSRSAAFFGDGEQNETESRHDRKEHQRNQERPKGPEISSLHKANIRLQENAAHIRRPLKPIARNSSPRAATALDNGLLDCAHPASSP
jgi:hypothetical protein